VDDYFKDWLTVIDGMNNENTYKLAWGRAIIELCHTFDVQEDNTVFTFEQIGEYVLKYFWNQTYFFKLYQGPAKSKPRIQQITEDVIEYYQTQANTKIPVWFDIAKPVLTKDKIKYNRFLRDISTALKQDVCWRFTKVGDINVDLYILDKDRRIIELTSHQHIVLKDHAFVLSQLLNYRWAQLLEKFNQSPRIALKVKGSTDEKIRRNNLTKFKHALLKQFPDGIVRDFYTDEILDFNDISIDHVIPWSFMYSDDIWNLVITSKANNSSKSNRAISEEYIKKLKDRNNYLVEYTDEHYKFELLEANESKFIDKFYYQFKT
jgi:hypothetical protein